jgi:hypothetical protein
MPADEIEPRFRLDPPEPNPTPRLGAPGPRFQDENVAERDVDEVEPPRPPMRTVTTLAIGTGVGLVLLIGLIFLLHRGGTPVTKPTPATDTASTAAAPSPTVSPSDTATTPPTVPTSPAPTSSAPPAPAPEPPPVSAAPVPVPAESAPPPVPVKPTVSKPAPAVPQNGPKHLRRTVVAAPWIIQAGAFRTTEHAQSVADGLVKAGYAAVVAKRPNGWFAIELHGYKTKAAAEETAKKLSKTQHIDTLVRRSTADQPVKPSKKSAE